MLRRSIRRWYPSGGVVLKHKATEELPHFDLCVIGGGPAGTAAALRAVDFGKKVCIVERNKIGGADLWRGALQSKTMWEMSKFLSRSRVLAPKVFKTGCDFGECGLVLNEEKMRRSLDQAAQMRATQIETALQAADIRVFHGHGSFVDSKELHVHNSKSGEYHAINADYFVIATGSKPRRHPHYYTDGKSIITSDEIMAQDLPKSIVIVGAGVIGCEFASILANFGKTKVNIIEKASRILPMEDEDISGYEQELLEKKGVTIHKECKLFDLASCTNADGSTSVHYVVQNNKTKEFSHFEVERALISIGRVPNYKGLGLENLKCRVTDGKLIVDPWGRCTPHDHIYAVGDATMDISLVNMGENEARTVIEKIYSERMLPPPSTENLSTIMFLDEEVAAVGYNEQQLQRKGAGYLVARYGYEFVSRAVAMGDTTGFVKIMVSNDNEKRVLGVRALGPHASSIVELASLAILNQQSAYDLAELMTAYPAITQGFQECVRMLINRSILKPNTFPSLVMKEWKPPMIHRGVAYTAGYVGESELIRSIPTQRCETAGGGSAVVEATDLEMAAASGEGVAAEVLSAVTEDEEAKAWLKEDSTKDKDSNQKEKAAKVEAEATA